VYQTLLEVVWLCYTALCPGYSVVFMIPTQRVLLAEAFVITHYCRESLFSDANKFVAQLNCQQIKKLSSCLVSQSHCQQCSSRDLNHLIFYIFCGSWYMTVYKIFVRKSSNHGLPGHCEGFVMCGCFGNMYTVLWLRFYLTWLRFFLTLTDVFPCLFLSCKANVKVKLT